MRHAQYKLGVLLILTLGLAIGVVSTGYADKWKTVNALDLGNRHASHQPAAGTLPQAGATVEVHSNFYLPASVTINVGDTVTWTRVEGFHNI
jgi:plastocyanin